MFTREGETMTGKRIRYYRLKKGLTLEELANKIGVTKTLISLYENDEREPNDENRKRIAEALDISWIQLLSRNQAKLNFKHANFRKKQKVSQREIELLKIEIENKCADRVALMSILGIIKAKNFSAKKLSVNDTAVTNAKKIRQHLGFPSSGPLYSITSVLEHAGIIVLSFECSEEIDGLNGMVNNIPYIFFNSRNRTIERQRFTIIHEVCHLFFEQGEENKEFEKYINLVSGNVLMPNDDIYEMFGRINRNINFYLRNNVAKEYKVAPSCLVNRLYEVGVVTEMYRKKFFMILNRNGGRKKEKTQLDINTDSEQPTIFTQQVYLALSDELISASKASEFLDVPLYDVMQNMRED